MINRVLTNKPNLRRGNQSPLTTQVFCCQCLMSPSQSKTQPGSRKPTYEAATKSRPSPGHTTHFKCPEHICATCGEKGHNHSNCPASQSVNKCDRPLAFCARMSIQNCESVLIICSSCGDKARASATQLTLATHNHNPVSPLCTNASVILGHNRGKWPDKFSAVEIIVDSRITSTSCRYRWLHRRRFRSSQA